jgi:hypothetical protein
LHVYSLSGWYFSYRSASLFLARIEQGSKRGLQRSCSPKYREDWTVGEMTRFPFMEEHDNSLGIAISFPFTFYFFLSLLYNPLASTRAHQQQPWTLSLNHIPARATTSLSTKSMPTSSSLRRSTGRMVYRYRAVSSTSCTIYQSLPP